MVSVGDGATVGVAVGSDGDGDGEGDGEAVGVGSPAPPQPVAPKEIASSNTRTGSNVSFFTTSPSPLVSILS